MNKLIIVMLLLPACAFKPSAQDVAQQALNKLDGRILGATLKWEGQEVPVVRQGSSFKLKAEGPQINQWISPETLSLPAKVPETIELELKIARDSESLKNLNISAIATMAENLIERKVSIDLVDTSPAEIGTTIRLKIGELHTLFRDDKEQRVSMHLTLKLINGELIKLELPFCTPPSLVAIEKLTIEDMSPGLQELTSQAKNLKLLQSLQLRNDTFERVRIGIPFRNLAKIRIPGKRYTIEVKPAEIPHLQTSTQKEAEENHETEAEFYLLPIKEDLPTSWTGYSQKDMDSLFLLPGEKIKVGLYIDEIALQWINTYPASKPAMQSSPVGGYATCPPEKTVPPLNHDPFSLYNNLNCIWALDPKAKGETQYSIIDLCNYAIDTINTCFASNFSNHEACTQAALNDDELYRRRRTYGMNAIPWYSCRNKCGANNCTKPDWDWVPLPMPFLKGLQTDPVTAEWDTGNLSATLRFAPQGGVEATESRAVGLVPQNMWLRD